MFLPALIPLLSLPLNNCFNFIPRAKLLICFKQQLLVLHSKLAKKPEALQ